MCSALKAGTPAPTTSTGQSSGIALMRGRRSLPLATLLAVSLSMTIGRIDPPWPIGLRWRIGAARGGNGSDARRTDVTGTAFYPRKSADPVLRHPNLTAKLRRRGWRASTSLVATGGLRGARRGKIETVKDALRLVAERAADVAIAAITRGIADGTRAQNLHAAQADAAHEVEVVHERHRAVPTRLVVDGPRNEQALLAVG